MNGYKQPHGDSVYFILGYLAGLFWYTVSSVVMSLFKRTQCWVKKIDNEQLTLSHKMHLKFRSVFGNFVL